MEVSLFQSKSLTSPTGIPSKREVHSLPVASEKSWQCQIDLITTVPLILQ